MIISNFQNPDLDGSSFSLKGNNGICVILIHGFTATTVEVRPIAEYLNQNGFSVNAPLLPGHGTSPEDLNRQAWRNWVDSVVEVYNQCRVDHEKIFIGGESMGGVITCYLAAMFPEIKGIMLYAPAIKIEKLGYSKYIRFFKKVIPKKNIKEVQEKDVFPWQGYKVNPTRAAYQLYLLQKNAIINLNKIKQPAIIFQGKSDKTISQEGPKLIYNNIHSTYKEFVLLENSEHCVLLDKDFKFLARKTHDFIKTFQL
jgi:carboxylesterase